MKQVTPSPEKGLSTVGGLSEEVMLAVYVTAFEQKMERSCVLDDITELLDQPGTPHF